MHGIASLARIQVIDPVAVRRNRSVVVAAVNNALVDAISMAVGSALRRRRGRAVLAHG